MANTYVFDNSKLFGILYDSYASKLGGYVEGSPGAVVGCADNFDQFFVYETKEACLDKAIELDPQFSKNTIYGSIKLDVEAQSPEKVTGNVNEQVVLFFECSSPDPGVTLSYQWYAPNNSLIPTATSSVFTFTPTAIQYSGTYRCECKASGAKNWTGDTNCYIKVALTEPITF